MAEPLSNMVVPIVAGGGLSGIAIFSGLDPGAVTMSFAGALLFAFMAKNTHPLLRLLFLVVGWIFGYYGGIEIADRGIFGFKTPPVPSFVAALLCVTLAKLILVLFDEEGKEWLTKWVRAKLGTGGKNSD